MAPKPSSDTPPSPLAKGAVVISRKALAILGLLVTLVPIGWSFAAKAMDYGAERERRSQHETAQDSRLEKIETSLTELIRVSGKRHTTQLASVKEMHDSIMHALDHDNALRDTEAALERSRAHERRRP